MDKVLRQRRERTRLKPQSRSPATVSNPFFPYRLVVNTANVRLGYVPVEVTVSSADALARFFCPAQGGKYIRFGYVSPLERTDLLIHAIFP
jgi:hypothetical protein